MIHQNFCHDCSQKHDCRKVYDYLGNIKGPSVLGKTILVFPLPMMIFIASLAVFEGILVKVIDTEQLRTAFGFLLALLVTFIFVVSCSCGVYRRRSATAKTTPRINLGAKRPTKL